MTDAAGAALKLPRIGLICAEALRVLGLKTLLCDGIEFRVDVLEAIRAADLADLDLVIIDAAATDHLRALIEAFRRMRPQVRLLVLGSEAGEDYTESVIGAGAQGYLCHASTGSDLRRAVAVVRDGSMWAPRKVLARLLERAARGCAARPRREAPAHATRGAGAASAGARVIRTARLGRRWVWMRAR